MSDATCFSIQKEYITCGICIEPWIDKQPKLLPCQHIFCLACLNQQYITDNCIKCPHCRIEINIPDNKVENLPKFFLNEGISENKLKSNFKKKSRKRSRESNFDWTEYLKDDSNPPSIKCRVLSVNESPLELHKNFKQNLIEEIENKQKLLQNNTERLIQDINNIKENWLDNMRKKIKETIDKVMNFKETKSCSIEVLKDTLRGNCINEQEIKNDFQRIFSDGLPKVNLKPELDFDEDTDEDDEEVEEEEKKENNIRIGQSDIHRNRYSLKMVTMFVVKSKFHFIADEGLYELPYDYYEKDGISLSYLIFRKRNSDEINHIYLDRRILKFIVTDKLIYAIEEDTGFLIKSTKIFGEFANESTCLLPHSTQNFVEDPSNGDIILSKIDGFELRSNDSSLIVLEKEKNKLFFFKNDDLKWSRAFSNRIRDFCFLDSNTILIGYEDQLTTVDLGNGRDMTSVNMEGNHAIKNVFSLRDNGYIVMDDSLPQFTVFNKQNKKLSSCELGNSQNYDGSTKSGLLAFCSERQPNILCLYELLL